MAVRRNEDSHLHVIKSVQFVYDKNENQNTLQYSENVLYYLKEFCYFLKYAPVAQWIEQWFPVPCAGVRFPSGVLPGTYEQFRCVV